MSPLVKLTQNHLELSRAELDELVIRHLREKHPGALPISVDYELRSEKCAVIAWWIPARDGEDAEG